MAAPIDIYPSNKKEDHLYKTYDRHQREFRRVTRNPNHLRRVVGKVATVAALGTTFVGLGHTLDKHNHIKSASTKAEIIAEVGHLPAGIKAIQETKIPGVEKVKYVVQAQPDKVFVSSVAADMHPIAPNQDPQAEFDAINSYLPKADSLYAGEEINMLVDVDKGEILPSPTSVGSDG
jgi:hypothetical protein